MNELKTGLLEHLRQIAFFLEYANENPFKIRAFRVATEVLAEIEEKELLKRLKEQSLTELKGIGKGIAAVCEEFKKRGKSKDLEQIQKHLPSSLLELAKIRGLGIKKIKDIYEKLGVSTLGELEYACQENRLVHLPGFGNKMQTKLLGEINRFKGNVGKMLLSDALERAGELEAKFDKSGCFARIGHLGRQLEVIETFDYLFVEKEKQDHSLKKIFGNEWPSGQLSKNREIRFKTKHGEAVSFRFCPEEEFVVQRVFHTSSEPHWKSLQEFAKRAGFSLESSSLKKNDKVLPLKTEEKLYEHLHLDFHPPESREFPAQKKLNLVTEDQLQGIFHAHSLYSDGENSVLEMSTACRDKAWQYFGLSDHSASAHYAGGLKQDRLKAYWKEISEAETQSGIRVFKGIESDILKNGELDYPQKTLKQFDFIIASVHQRFGLSDMTERILKAIDNPYTTMIGHLSGRLLLGRDAYQLQMDRIVKRAIERKVIIELNSHPQRLDIDWRFLFEACSAGLLISINPDAHSIGGLEATRFGVAMARKALVSTQQIFNTWDLKAVEKFLSEKRANA